MQWDSLGVKGKVLARSQAARWQGGDEESKRLPGQDNLSQDNQIHPRAGRSSHPHPTPFGGFYGRRGTRMGGSRRCCALEKGWLEYVSTLDPQEIVVVPIHAVTSVQVRELRELRLHAYLPDTGFGPLGRLYSVAETLSSRSRRLAWRLRMQDFVVEEELRGRGIGSQMLTLFLRMAQAEGCEYVSGELSSQDAIDGSVGHLVRFYQRHGFDVSRIPRPGPILATIRRDMVRPTPVRLEGLSAPID